MAFVNEEIPENEKARFSDTSIFFNPESKSRPIKLRRWVIDRDRDICMICLGGGVGPSFTDPPVYPPIVMAMCWEGEFIKFEAEYMPDGDCRLDSPPCDLYVNVQKVMLPTNLKNRQATAFQLIKEAIETGGDHNFNMSGFKSVIVAIQNRVVYSNTMQENIYGLHL